MNRLTCKKVITSHIRVTIEDSSVHQYSIIKDSVLSFSLFVQSHSSKNGGVKESV